MAISDSLILDLSQANAQIDDLERQLDALLQPIQIPVEIQGEQALNQLQSQIRTVDNDDIDIDVDVDGIAKADREFEDLNREIDDTTDELRKAERQADETTNAMLRIGTRGTSAFTNLRGSLLGVGAAFVAFQGGKALLGFFDDAIDSASDLEESTSKAQVVFGSFFDDIEQFASTAPQALGLANSEALEFTGTFGNLFVALGLSQQAASDLAPEIVQLGADLASFNNLEVTEALDKLRAGLVGEAEPLRALGVNLTAAATNAKALELGLAGSNGEVSEAAKVQARYALILEQTATAQGDFARTADGIANRQRTLAAEFENLRATVGEALLPAFESILDIAPALIEFIEAGLVPAIESLASALASVDTEGFASTLAELPSAVAGTLGSLSSGAQAVGNLGAAFVSLVSLNVPDFFTQLGQASEDIDNIFASQTARQAIQDLIVTLQAGRDPAEAFEATLVQLGRSVSNLSLEQFESLVDQLLSIANLGDLDIAQLIPTIQAFGVEAGFSEEGVQILVQSLLEARSAAGTLPPPLNEIADAVARAGDAAKGSAAGVSTFTQAVADLDFEGINTAFNEIETQFNRLPDGLDAAAAALRDDENEIVEDFTDFLDQLDDEIAARQAFRDNLAILRAMGLDNLEEVFTEAGLDAAAALADAVANPEEARRAEALLAEDARNQAAAVRDAFTEELQGLPIDLTLPVNITAAIQSLQVQGLDALDAVNVVGAAGAGPNIGAGVTVNQTFVSEPAPTPATARAAQQANAIITQS